MHKKTIVEACPEKKKYFTVDILDANNMDILINIITENPGA